jgi:putative membrane-bound dehydrogenase-like protein
MSWSLMIWRLLLTCVFLIAGATFGASAEEDTANRFRLPDGFVIEQVAGEPGVRFPMFAVFDDRGRLFVAESSGLDLYAEISAGTRRCRIRLLEDRDGDGKFETSRIFADQLVFPMGLAWHDGKLYVADPPDLIVLEDTDGDGRADRRTVILSGFGHKDNGSLHGLTFGPDGLLYMTMGEPDGFALKRRDGTVLQGKTGALIRCRPDGSDPEVLCSGFENLVEVVFTPRGDMIATDNWFQRPSGGMRDALVHLVEGGLYPIQFDQDKLLPRTGEPLPAASLFPAVALSGLMRYRGFTLPAEMHGNLFSAQHNARKVGRHVLVPNGSTFRTQNFDFVSTDDPDFHPSDVLEAADGSLILVDTGSWYVHHCPTGQIRKTQALGGIYRVRFARAKPVEDPWGLTIGWDKQSSEQLVKFLSDRRPAVQDRAGQVLAGRGGQAVDYLAAVLQGTADVEVKQRAIWTLAAIPDPLARVPLRKALHDANPDVMVPAVRALGLRADRQVLPDLCRLLAADSSPVCQAAAAALARCGSARALPAIWQALARHPDRFLEHALTYTLHHVADAPALLAALELPNPCVQKAALLLLDQPPRPRGALGFDQIKTRLKAGDAELRQTALHILTGHPEWAEHATGLVRDWLEKPVLTPEESLELQNLVLAFQGQTAIQELIGSAVTGRGGRVPEERQVLLLITLSQNSLPELPKSWIDGLERALQRSAPAVRRQAVRTLAVLQVPNFDHTLAQLADSKEETPDIRLEALRAVVSRRSRLSDNSFALLIRQLGDQDNPGTRLTAAEILGRSRLGEVQLSRLLQAIWGDALIAPAVVLPALRRSVTATTATAFLDYLTESIRTGWRPSEQELSKALEGLPSAVQLRTTEVRELLRRSTEGQRARLAKFDPLLVGGNAGRGRAVFFGKKVACATCHRIAGIGGQVGPDLTNLAANRSGRDILESIVLPSSTIAQGYEPYFVATADGRAATGVIARQTPEILVLRDSSGAELRLRKDQIQEMRRQATSIMPEGLERALSTDELRDLLAFLKSLK